MADQVEKHFSDLSAKVVNLLYGRTEGDRNIISKTLDALNSINYRYTVVSNHTKAVLLLNQCCTFIPTDDKVLVQKCSQLIVNLVGQQNIVVEGRTLTITVQWCLESLKIKEDSTVVSVLYALEALLRNNVQNMDVLQDNVVREVSAYIYNSETQKSADIILMALQCLEACTMVSANVKPQSKEGLSKSLNNCAQIFNGYLCTKQDIDPLVYSKILRTCLSGLQNIIIQCPEYLQKELGVILGIIKSFMLYGIKGVDFIVPQNLKPSTHDIPEIPSTSLREKKGGKLTKQRKHRPVGGKPKKDHKNAGEISENASNSGYTPATTSLEYSPDGSPGINNNSRLTTSDSDFSDTEGGKMAKLHHVNGKVRQTALNLFTQVIKQTEKSVIFSYWSSFIPEGPTSGKHNLLTCILKDPSARGRMTALNVLLVLLTTSKLYLSQAEVSEKTTAFTPFSVILGLTLTELHKGLCLALSDFSVPVVTQVLKCLAALVQATPYHRMTPGLITKVVRNVKGLVYHKDASVQVTALIVMGCILASEPVVSETKENMLRVPQIDQQQNKKMLKPQNKNNTLEQEQNKNQPEAENKNTTAQQQNINNLVRQNCALSNNGLNLSIEDFDFAQFSSEEDEDIGDNLLDGSSVPWLLKRCLENLGMYCDEKIKASGPSTQTEKIVPAPVKLESLQVLAAMSRNYFDSMLVNHLNVITKALDIVLTDKYTDVRLHAGRAIDFIGQAMNKYLTEEGPPHSTLVDHCNSFWHNLLNGSFVNLLQCEQYPTLRAIGCDCLGSIGAPIFEQLSRDKQILCVTLLFACTRDEENIVRGAAVRALAICVLYPSLREDTGFVVDTAEAIHRTLKDENLMVRVKASWSLGNLSDALVLNSKSNEIIEDLPETLILTLLSSSTSSANDCDKIKMNAARAIGNLLQLVDEKLLRKEDFLKASETALSALVKNCTAGSNMKVRWNACYALGNALKNPFLYTFSHNWQASVFNSLCDLVVGFRNFKVRINAAVALASPAIRQNYGHFYVGIWGALLKALENSHNMEDFTEYQHRDHLVDQICLTLGHLTTLITTEDLTQLEDKITLYFETLKKHMHRVLERLVPEKSAELFSASAALNGLEIESSLSGRQRYVVGCLTDVFVPDNTAINL